MFVSDTLIAIAASRHHSMVVVKFHSNYAGLRDLVGVSSSDSTTPSLLSLLSGLRPLPPPPPPPATAAACSVAVGSVSSLSHRVSQPITLSCHTIEFIGFTTQWFSSWK